MSKLKSILKAFVVIAVIPILLIGGISALVYLGPYCFDINHPLLTFFALILMLPWGLLFVIVFFLGVGLTPSIVVIPTGHGGYSVSSGTSRDGGGAMLILNIIKMIILVPLSLLIWLVVSIILIFSTKLQKKIDEYFENFVEELKTWYIAIIILFVVAPLITTGLNALENKLYSPKNMDFEFVELVYNGSGNFYATEYYVMTYTINPNGENISGYREEWEFIDKKTGESFIVEGGCFANTSYWWSADKEVDHQFDMTLNIPSDDTAKLEILSNDIKDIKILCRIKEITFNPKFSLLGENITNKFKNGYEIVVKP